LRLRWESVPSNSEGFALDFVLVCSVILSEAKDPCPFHNVDAAEGHQEWGRSFTFQIRKSAGAPCLTGGPRFKLAEKIGAPCLACLWPDVGSRTLHLSGAVDFAFAFAFVFVFALVFAVSS
jgi:hypothetical protein